MYTLLSSAFHNLLSLLAFPTVIVLVISLYSDYFSRFHPYRLEISRNGMKFKEKIPVYTQYERYHINFSGKRGVHDPVMYTNLTYLVFGLFSLYYFKERELAILQVFTFLGSTMYHFSKEANYFNLDQTFAGALGCIFVLSLYDAYTVDLDYFLIGSFVALPLGIFLFDYCGMPADIIYEPFCCVRKGRIMYDMVHSIWHIVSAMGPLACSFFYSQYFPQDHLVLGRGYLDPMTRYFPKVPVYSLLISLTVNMLGNAVGVLPPK